MEGGDLGLVSNRKIYVVLEGVVCQPTFKGKLVRRVRPADQWEWSTLALKRLNTYHYQNIHVDLITFMAPEVAEMAGEYLTTLGVEYRTCSFRPFDMFCESLGWLINNVDRVVDSSPSRINMYGQLGYMATVDGEF